MNCVEGVMEIVVIDSGEMFQGPTAPKGTTGQPRAERSAALGREGGSRFKSPAA